MKRLDFSKYLERVKNTDGILYTGRVKSVKGLEIVSEGPVSKIGEICYIAVENKKRLMAEVVALKGNSVHLTAFGNTEGIEVGNVVTASGSALEVGVGDSLLGRVIDSTGKPFDKLGNICVKERYPAVGIPPSPLERKAINRRIVTGVRAIDSILAVGKGQRLGIFAGSGVGKSTLLSIMARNTNADVNVIGLVGERGREVLDFINRDLGEEGLKKSVVVVATSDQPAISRLRAAYVCTAVAEYFRDQGKDVMLMMDSVTRFAHAQREIALASGEPPAQRGYPPSVFDMIPKLLERSGTSSKGSITAFYTVLVDGDDMNEPISDKVRGTLDGHIVLSRKLAEKNHYPAIDVLSSISRLHKRVTGVETLKAVDKIRHLLAIYDSNSKMIEAGIYQKGADAKIDEAIEYYPKIEAFLTQEESEKCSIKDTLDKLSLLSGISFPEEEYGEEPSVREREVGEVALHDKTVDEEV